MSAHAIRVTDPVEALVVAQALALVRELRQTCPSAPHGHVLAQAELVALGRGRERTRQALEAVLNQSRPRRPKKRGAGANLRLPRLPRPQRPGWPLRANSSVPVEQFQIFTVWSSLPEASRSPSGLNATLQTAAAWPLRENSSLTVALSQILTVPS
jgi:hypothetical protein